LGQPQAQAQLAHSATEHRAEIVGHHAA
jgi:hypothetical protein